MRILFICSTVEPGKDGVGDYTRRLCAEIIRQGNEAAIIGINDKQIAGSLESGQQEGVVNINVLRLSSALPWKQRVKSARAYLENFNPDWLSLQYVPFGFHDKGLPFGLASHLKTLGKGLRWHIMFHELWVGMDAHADKKMIAWGWVQRKLIKLLIHRLRPVLIHTQTYLYLQQLSRIGVVNAAYLPLFGNIPIADKPDGFCTKGLKEICVIYFGSFSGQLNELEFQLQFVQSISLSSNKPVKFFVLGDNGRFKEQALLIAQKIFGTSSVECIGRLSANKISEYMLNADIGISRADFTLYGKSGSTIAMLEHGLPVVLRGMSPGKHILSEDNYFIDGQLLFRDDTINSLPAKKCPNYFNAGDIAKKFIGCLRNS